MNTLNNFSGAHAAAVEAIRRFDSTGTGKLNRFEAEPMLKEAFEMLKG